MKASFFYILILLGLNIAVYAQQSIKPRVFYKHQQVCHITGTTEYDYIIVLASGGAVSIEKLWTNYKDLYQTLNKNIFEGIYNQVSDTVFITITNRKFDSRNPIEKENKWLTKQSNESFIQDPPLVFVIKQNTIQPVKGYFPILDVAPDSIIESLNSKFFWWGRIKPVY